MLARENKLSLVSNEGPVLIYTCSVIGEGSTVWTGSAFDCPRTNDSIVLRHTIKYNTTVGTCNSGIIFGKVVAVEGDCFTSQLNISATPDLKGKNITCIQRNGNEEMIVGSEIIELYRGILLSCSE